MDVVSVTLLFVLACMALEFVRQSSRRRRKSADDASMTLSAEGQQLRVPPPAGQAGVHCHWLLGHLPYILRSYFIGGVSPVNAVEALEKVSAAPVTALYIGPPFLVRPFYFCFGEKAGQRLMAKASPALRVTEPLSFLMGPGSLAAGLKGSELKRHRKALAASMLRTNKLNVMAALTGKHCAAMLTACAASPGNGGGKGGPDSLLLDDLGQLAVQLSQGAMMEMFIGVDFSAGSRTMSPADRETFFARVKFMLAYLSHAIISVFPVRVNMLLHPLRYLAMRSTTRYMRDVWVQPTIERRRADLAAGRECGDDALGTMLAAETLGDAQSLSDEDICDEIVSLISAAETSAAVLQWLLLELGRHPDIQAKCREEVVSFVGPYTDASSWRSPTHTQLQQMSYVQALLKENMRVNPISKVHLRDITTDLEIEGYLLKKGSPAAFTYYLAQMSEKNFSSASEFSVERWLSDPVSGGAKDGRDTLSYAPFGYGPHRCFGQAVGTNVLGVVICMILQRYRVELVSDAAEAKRVLIGTTLQPEKLVVRLVPLEA